MNNETTPFDSKYYFENQTHTIDGIAIDPLLPEAFYHTANEERHPLELTHWWGRPFITTEKFDDESYEEYCQRVSQYDNYTPETKEAFTARKEENKKSWYSNWQEGIRYNVQCLNGGAWDRPTYLGQFATLEEALDLAKQEPMLYQVLTEENTLEFSDMIKIKYL